jgi:hypothetical protein
MPETRQREVHYPESDGKPLAESDFHFEVIIDLIHALQTRYAKQPDVYVTGNLLLYYVEGDPCKSVSPDVFVTWGISKGRRKNYLLWREERAPGFVIEVTSGHHPDRGSREEEGSLLAVGRRGVHPLRSPGRLPPPPPSGAPPGAGPVSAPSARSRRLFAEPDHRVAAADRGREPPAERRGDRRAVPVRRGGEGREVGGGGMRRAGGQGPPGPGGGDRAPPERARPEAVEMG